MTAQTRGRGRPAKPMFPAAPAPAGDSDLASAFADLADGAMSYEQASEFCGALSESHLRRAIDAGEIETFSDGRRVLLVKRSVQLWLAAKLAAERRKKRLESLGIPTEG